jgi:hypothetical protein
MGSLITPNLKNLIFLKSNGKESNKFIISKVERCFPYWESRNHTSAYCPKTFSIDVEAVFRFATNINFFELDIIIDTSNNSIKWD